MLSTYLDTTAWCDEDEINDWNLLNRLFRSLKLQRDVLWQMSKPGQLHMRPRSSSYSTSRCTVMSADDLSSSFVHLSIGTFAFSRAAAPALAQLQSVLFRLEGGSYESSTDEVGSTLPLSAKLLWEVYTNNDSDSIIGYLLTMVAWARNRVSLLSLRSAALSSSHRVISDVEKNTSIVDFCRDNETVLFLPCTSEDSGRIHDSIRHALRRQGRLKAVVLATIDEWIQMRHGRFVE